MDAGEFRKRQFIQQAKLDVEKVFARLERQLFEDTTGPSPIFQQVEHFFGRLLSPIEIETVKGWMDTKTPELVAQAIREASLQNVRNVRYIDRILSNWESSGIQDLKGAQAFSEKFRKNGAAPVQRETPQESNVKKVPFYNWLKERES